MNDNDLAINTAGPHTPIPDIDDSASLINSSTDFGDCDLSVPVSNKVIDEDMVLAPGSPSQSLTCKISFHFLLPSPLLRFTRCSCSNFT
jgi:hypothetical protein